MKEKQLAEWVLRIGVAMEFAGHGWLALGTYPPWLAFFRAVGLNDEIGETLMPVVGVWDLFLALMVLVYPIRALVAWMAFWGLWTAFLRPLSGQPIVEMIERGANFGAPLALLLLRGAPGNWRDWLRW